MFCLFTKPIYVEASLNVQGRLTRDAAKTFLDKLKVELATDAVCEQIEIIPRVSIRCELNDKNMMRKTK